MIVQGDEDARRMAINAGFADCITKPFNPDKTIAVMYKVMGLPLLDTSALLRILLVQMSYPHL